MKPLGQRLVEAGLINDTQLQSALREQQKTREYLGRILIRLGYVSEEAVAAALSAQARVKYVDLAQYSPQPEALQLVAEKFAREHHLVPLSYVGKVLVVAMANPLDIITIDEMRRMSKGPVEVVGATQTEVLEALDRAYGVGVGTPGGSVMMIDGQLSLVPFDSTLLQRISQLTEGKYYSITQTDELKQLYRQLGRSMGWERRRTEITSVLAGGAGFLMLAGGLFSLIWFRRVP